MENTLKSKILSKNAHIGIIGLGYVGLPLVIRFSEEGFKVSGFDTDNKKIEKLKKKESYINHISKDKIKFVCDKGFKGTSDFERVSKIDVLIICVPTPLGVHNEPDLSYIKSTMKSISPYLKKNQLLILESTTYPGTTDEEIVPNIDEIENLEIGDNFFVGYSPEREDPGNDKFNTKNIPKIVSGYTNNCKKLTTILYNQIVDKTVPVSSIKVAEMTKILENIHRSVNIGLVNELKMVADRMNINIYEVIEAAATKPFGFTPYFPGPGLGGHCIPIDPFYLTWKAKEIGMNTRFIELAGEINTQMPDYVIQKVGEALNLIGKSISGSNIIVLGLSYKKNVDDLRESPSLVIINKLVSLKANVQFSDPYFSTIPKTRKNQLDLISVALTPENLSHADLIVLATDHDSFDYKLIEREAKLIVDARGRFNNSNKVVNA